MKLRLCFLLLLGLSLNSCLFEDNSKQEFPKFDFNSVEKIEIKKVFDYQFLRIIDERKKLNNFTSFFIDSTNYFKNEKYKYGGKRALYHLEFYNKEDTLQLTIYPKIDNTKTEIGFFGKTISNYKENGMGRKFHRFFISKKILDLIENEN
jgi:hypothetical protein